MTAQHCPSTTALSDTEAVRVADGHYRMGDYDLIRTKGKSWRVIHRTDTLTDRTIVPTLALARAWVTERTAK